MNARIALSNRGGLIALTLMVVTMLALSPAASPVLAQYDDAATPDGSVEVTTEPEPATDETPPPTDEAVDTGDTEPPTDIPVTEPAETPPPTEETTETEATPPPPTPTPTATPELTPGLTYAIAAPLTCTPALGTSDEIAAGGTRDYACTFAVDLHGQNLTADQIALAWDVAATTESTWSVRLASAAIADGAWSDPGQISAHLVAGSTNLDSVAAIPAADGQGTRLDGRITIAFQMRLERPPCTNDPVSVTLSASATASTPGAPDATVTLDGAQPEPLVITPNLIPLVVAAPDVTIESVSINPVAFSLDDRTTTGVLTIRVDNSTVQCSAYDITISIQAFVGTDITDSASILTTGELTGAPDGAYVAGASPSGTALATPVIVSSIAVGATPGSYIQTITYAVAVPGQIAAGTFDVRASATVVERKP